MTDYVPHFTARLKLRYRVQSKSHDLVVRFPRVAPVPGVVQMQEKVRAVLLALESHIYDDWTILGWSVAGLNSTVFVPVAPITGITGGAPSAGRLISAQAAQYRVEAVSADGSRSAFVLFGMNYPVSSDDAADFRITGSEDAPTQSAIDALNNNGTARFATASGDTAIWRQYANLKYNDKYVRQIRS